MHVRVCRECGQEYRPEVIRCSDCGGELEDRHVDEAQLLEPEPAEPVPEDALSPGNYQSIAWGGHAADLVPLADRLLAVEIPFRIRPREVDPGEPGKGFDLVVRDEERERALAEMAAAEGAAPAGPEFDPATGYKRCPACSAELKPGLSECSDCGLGVAETPSGHRCPRCNEAMPPDEVTCPHCGFGLP